LSRKYKVKSVPKPEFYFLGKTSGGLPRGMRIQGNKVLVKNPPSSILDVNYVVTKFTLEVSTSRGNNTIGSSSSHVLTTSMKNAIKNLQRGDRFSFSKIEYKVVGNSSKKPLGTDVSYKAT